MFFSICLLALEKLIVAQSFDQFSGRQDREIDQVEIPKKRRCEGEE
jgi:hypothetical protein